MKKRLFALITAVVTVITAGIPTAEVLAVPDVLFYSQNNIVAYDPDSCGAGIQQSGGSGHLVGNDNYEKALRYYVGKGLSLVQASGILGNFDQESSMNPAIIQGGKIADEKYALVAGVGFGIAQWTTEGRQKNLTAFSKTEKKNLTDLGLQLDFSWKELNESYASTLKALKQDDTPGDAALTFHKGYEGSADNAAQLKERTDAALHIYGQYHTTIPDGGSSKSAGSQVCTGNGKASAYVDGFKLYSQYDTRWANNPYGRGATIAEAGCGPSAVAMIITALTKQEVTPAETAAYGAENGTVAYNADGSNGGSKYSVGQIIAPHWGLTVEDATPGGDVSIARFNEGLRKGQLILASAIGPAPFTTNGHVIVIRAVTASGKWLVADSNFKPIGNGEENSKKEWDPKFITDILKSAALKNDQNAWFIFKEKAGL